MVDENLYLFTGTAEIFIQNRISRIISSYDKQQVTIIKYDMEQTSFSRVLEDACTIPFLEDLKIIILRNPTFLTTKGELANDAKNFIKYLKKPVDTSIIIINATNITPNPSNEIYKALKNYAMIIDYSDSEEIEIKGWITRTAAYRNIEIKVCAGGNINRIVVFYTKNRSAQNRPIVCFLFGHLLMQILILLLFGLQTHQQFFFLHL